MAEVEIAPCFNSHWTAVLGIACCLRIRESLIPLFTGLFERTFGARHLEDSDEQDGPCPQGRYSVGHKAHPVVSRM